MDNEWFKEKLEKIDTKLDKQGDKINSLEVNYATMAVDVNYHIQRTDLLQNELVPIKNRYEQVMGVVKFLGAVGTVVGLIEGFIRLYLKA